MIESWRWYGDLDDISLDEIAQTGARGIVTALHEIPYGEVWQSDTIAARKSRITDAGFDWVVVESLPVHERIKKGDGDLSALFANYRQSMANLAANGVQTICYNFMPLLDWTRTDLTAPVAGGATCLRFEAARMAAFEIHMLGRRAAEDDYPTEVLNKAAAWFQQVKETATPCSLRSWRACRVRLTVTMLRACAWLLPPMRALIAKCSARITNGSWMKSSPRQKNWECACASTQTTRHAIFWVCPGSCQTVMIWNGYWPLMTARQTGSRCVPDRLGPIRSTMCQP